MLDIRIHNFCGCLIYLKIGEDKDYSVLANVELKKLFPTKKVKAMDKHLIPSTEIECSFFLVND